MGPSIVEAKLPTIGAGKNDSYEGDGYIIVRDQSTEVGRVYGTEKISERHRHRFEVNNAYRLQLQDCGMVFSGLSPDGELVEMIELPSHPHFIGCQFHPEFLSRPDKPHPLFASLVEACLKAKGAC